ncbi:hypothetical protein ACSBR2_040223 [Camellia fascicularis]
MEEHKLRYFNDFMRRSGKSLEELVKIMKEMEKEIRECYAETIYFECYKFLEIILVDAAFIIEFPLRNWFHHLITPNDRIFRKPWMIYDINDDLLLLENQIPFFVLQYLFKMTNIQVGFQFSRKETLLNPFIYLTLNWFRSSLEIQEHINLSEKEHILDFLEHTEIEHVLDFLRICLIPKESSQPSEEKNPSKVKQSIAFLRSFIPRQSSQQTERKFNIPSVTELHMAGVKFKFYYTVIMDYLINTSKDVELLVQAKIIENWLSDNNDVSNLFNGLNKKFAINRKAYYFTKLHKELNDYCEIRSHKWKANLRQDYCNTPWRVLSIIVAAILLGLTFIQSLCSLVSCNK